MKSLFFTDGLSINDGKPTLKPFWHMVADNLDNIVCGVLAFALFAYVLSLPAFN